MTYRHYRKCIIIPVVLTILLALWYCHNINYKSRENALQPRNVADVIESTTRRHDFSYKLPPYTSMLLNIQDDSTRVGEDESTRLREDESTRLGELVQRRITFLQNPAECSTARKLVCSIVYHCGFGCHIHLIMYCLVQAYATNRTLILESKGWHYEKGGWETMFQPLSNTCTDAKGSSIEKWTINTKEEAQVMTLSLTQCTPLCPAYMPLAIPEDLADSLMSFHGDPSVWWVGQFMKYVTRPKTHLENHLQTATSRIGFVNPVVGVHVRRTDKLIREAKFHGIDEYMVHVEKWYNEYETRVPGVRRNVFLATDEPTLHDEAQKLYPNYTFISDHQATKAAGVYTRYSRSSLLGLIQDLHFLYHSDFLVCTFSSNVGRAAYELMQTLHVDASQWYKSLDTMYFVFQKDFEYNVYHDLIAIEDHVAKPNLSGKEIDLRRDDQICIRENFWNGYLKGTNQRTRETGLFLSNKTVVKYVRTKMPTYPGA